MFQVVTMMYVNAKKATFLLIVVNVIQGLIMDHNANVSFRNASVKL